MHKDVVYRVPCRDIARLACQLTCAAVERQAKTACCVKWGLSWLWCWRSAFPSVELMSASCTTDFAVHRVPRDVANFRDSARYKPGVPALQGVSPSEPSQCPDHKMSCHSLVQKGHLAKSVYKNTVIYLYENIIFAKNKGSYSSTLWVSSNSDLQFKGYVNRVFVKTQRFILS